MDKWGVAGNFGNAAHRFHRPTHPLIILRAIYQELLVQRKREKDVMHSSFQHNLRLRRHFLCSQSVMLHSVNSIQISPGRWFISARRELKKRPCEYTESSMQSEREWYLSLSASPKWALFIWSAAWQKKLHPARHLIYFCSTVCSSLWLLLMTSRARIHSYCVITPRNCNVKLRSGHYSKAFLKKSLPQVWLRALYNLLCAPQNHFSRLPLTLQTQLLKLSLFRPVPFVCVKWDWQLINSFI